LTRCRGEANGEDPTCDVSLIAALNQQDPDMMCEVFMLAPTDLVTTTRSRERAVVLLTCVRLTCRVEWKLEGIHCGVCPQRAGSMT
jgi:hypothetical protein